MSQVQYLQIKTTLQVQVQVQVQKIANPQLLGWCCPKLQRKHQDSQHSAAVFRTALPLHCRAQLAKHLNFLNLIEN